VGTSERTPGNEYQSVTSKYRTPCTPDAGEVDLILSLFSRFRFPVVVGGHYRAVYRNYFCGAARAERLFHELVRSPAGRRLRVPFAGDRAGARGYRAGQREVFSG